MSAIEPIDLEQLVLDITPDLAVTAREQPPGPPHRIAGMTLGLATLLPGQSPHNGEMHPDGDEILILLSGLVRVHCDDQPEPVTLEPQQACVVRKGVWHQTEAVEVSQVIYVSPGPNGEARD